MTSLEGQHKRNFLTKILNKYEIFTRDIVFIDFISSSYFEKNLLIKYFLSSDGFQNSQSNLHFYNFKVNLILTHIRDRKCKMKSILIS